VPSASVLSFPQMAKRTPTEELPNRIRELRAEAGMTLQELAPKVGISAGQLSNIETGKRELTMPVMERVAAAFKVDVADLLLPSMGGLTEQERWLIETFREVPDAARAAMAAVAESQQPFRGMGEVVPFNQGRKSA
jgi:transcriptional regulator with XRE-family HTH domain